MLARMGRFLENKSVNLFTQRLGGIVAIVTHGRHEEFFADRESRGERIEKSGPARIATVPPTLRRLAPAEFPVASLYSVADRRGRLLNHHGLLRSEGHTSELQSLMRISYAVFCLKKKRNNYQCTVDL